MGILNAISTTIGMNGVAGNLAGAIANSAQNTLGQNTLAGYATQERSRTKNKTVFSGRIEVQKVVNGYVVNIATREGYEFDTHIAATVKEVNDIISTAIVAFQLEDR